MEYMSSRSLWFVALPSVAEQSPSSRKALCIGNVAVEDLFPQGPQGRFRYLGYPSFRHLEAWWV